MPLLQHPLFQPLAVGPFTLPNRVVLAPLVRARCDAERAPTDLVATYYAQRASAGLLITEGTHISPGSATRPTAAAIHSERQTLAWGRVVDAVHAAGGIVFQQIYHVGRKALAATLPNGEQPVAPSAIAANGGIQSPGQYEPFPEPRALALDEIPGIVADYREAARNARRSGFDGIEILAANGFLVDQFLRDGTNRRTDAYGGSIENRARFLLEVVDAVSEVFGASRIGVRLSPHFRADGITDSDPLATFGHAAEALGRRGVAYLHVLEGVGRDNDPFRPLHLRMAGGSSAIGPADGEPYLAPHLRRHFPGPLILNGNYTRTDALEAVASGRADAISFGRLFIANPDLPERLRRDAPLAAADPATFFTGGARGYTDYPVLEPA